ncbi:MAG: phosphoribosylanthranilate isomerase [Verrucomicrobiota bacterium]
MINGIRFKICGLRRVEDARAAVAVGADYLGFILYPKSPRYLSLADYKQLAPTLPAGAPRVAVMVEPSLSELMAAQAAGFDRVQIHFNVNLPLVRLREWSELVGAEKLWLAPKLPPESGVSTSLIPMAQTFLLDTFHAEGFGGSGQTGDWGKFAAHRAAFPDKTWILAGGLSPENVADAIRASGTDFVDVNSGVEESSGVKSADKIARLAEVLAGL